MTVQVSKENDNLIKAIYTTYRGKSHPYMDLLTGALADEGVEVEFAYPGYWTLLRAVKEHGLPDIFHLQWQHPLFLASRLDKMVILTVLFFVQYFFLRLLGVRFVWTVHELLHFGTNRPGWEMAASRLLARLVEQLIVHCDTAVPIVADELNIKRSRISVMIQGHYADYYPPAPTQQEARSQLDISSDSIVLLFFGHIRPYKGIDKLMNSFSQTDVENAQLIVLGKPHGATPELVPQLTEIAAKDSRITTRFEYIPDDELAVYLGACDLVALPYTDSLTSAAALLASSYGRPILAPKLGCMGEFPADTAILYDPLAADGLQNAMNEALMAPLTEMGKASKQYSLQFPWSLAATKTKEVYLHVLKKDHVSQQQTSEALR